MNDISAFRNREKINSQIEIGSGEYVNSTIEGDLYGIAIAEDGKETSKFYKM